MCSCRPSPWSAKLSQLPLSRRHGRWRRGRAMLRRSSGHWRGYRSRVHLRMRREPGDWGKPRGQLQHVLRQRFWFLRKLGAHVRGPNTTKLTRKASRRSFKESIRAWHSCGELRRKRCRDASLRIRAGRTYHDSPTPCTLISSARPGGPVLQCQPVPYRLEFKIKMAHPVVFGPETFFGVKAPALTRPIKGSAPRGHDAKTSLRSGTTQDRR